MSLVGFLRETSPGEMAHTPLSASFVSKPSHLDAAMFLAETAVPSALHMVANTERHGQSREPRHSAYTMAFNTPQSFQSHCQQRSKLQHQWTAFLRDVTNVVDDWAAVGPLDSIDWSGLGDACVVDVSSSYFFIHPCFSVIPVSSVTHPGTGCLKAASPVLMLTLYRLPTSRQRMSWLLQNYTRVSTSWSRRPTQIQSHP